MSRVHGIGHVGTAGGRRCSRPDGCRRRPSARQSGGKEREGRGKRRRQSTAHPGVSTAMKEAAEAEEDYAAARVDEGGGVPAGVEWDGGVDEVSGGAAKRRGGRRLLTVIIN